MENGAPSVTITGATVLLLLSANSWATAMYLEALWSLGQATAPSGWTMWAALEMRAPFLNVITVAWDNTTVIPLRTLELYALVSYNTVGVRLNDTCEHLASGLDT